jgi:hypothetical protein
MDTGINWRALAERRLEDNKGLIEQINSAESIYAELKYLYVEMTSQRDVWKRLYQDTRMMLEEVLPPLATVPEVTETTLKDYLKLVDAVPKVQNND